jgi:hypothetical protein
MEHDSCCMHRGIHQIASLTKAGSVAGLGWNEPDEDGRALKKLEKTAQWATVAETATEEQCRPH